MASPSADRDLLFGLLALQNGLIDQAQLVAAFQAWTLDKDRPMAEHLVAMGHLDDDDRAAIDVMAARHIRKHGDAERSLASLIVGWSTRAWSRASGRWFRHPPAAVPRPCRAWPWGRQAT